MSDSEVLKKAIQKAIDGGGRPLFIDNSDLDVSINETGTRVKFGYKNATGSVSLVEWSTLGVIFNHDFAKALWGSLKVPRYGEDKYPYADGQLIPAWQHHLQQMVLAEDPIAYLRDHLESAS